MYGGLQYLVVSCPAAARKQLRQAVQSCTYATKVKLVLVVSGYTDHICAQIVAYVLKSPNLPRVGATTKPWHASIPTDDATPIMETSDVEQPSDPIKYVGMVLWIDLQFTT